MKKKFDYAILYKEKSGDYTYTVSQKDDLNETVAFLKHFGGSNFEFYKREDVEIEEMTWEDAREKWRKNGK